jgi:4-amino-4-deoxy-L-arabinose transferase-like glycosyltransferase
VEPKPVQSPSSWSPELAALTGDSATTARQRIAFLLAILVLGLGVGVFDHDIWSPTEPTVAGVVSDMAQTGDLAVPRIHGFAYLEKPPLYYWSAWLAGRLSGRSDAGILRLPAALFGLASLALVWWTSRRFHGERIAWASALLGATSFSLVEVFHRACTDSAAIFFAFLIFSIFAESLLPATAGDERKARRPDVLLAAALACSFYAKNFYVHLVAVPPITVFLILRRDLRRLLRIGAWTAGLHLLLIGPWCVVLYRAGGWEYLRSVFVDNTLGRYLDLSELGRALPMPMSDAFTAEKGHSPLVYLWGLLYLPLPWTPLFAAAVFGLYASRARDGLGVFVKVAVPTMVLALALSSSRVAIYLVPVLWPCLLAAGAWLRRLDEGSLRSRWIAASLGLCGLAVLAAPVLAAQILGRPALVWATVALVPPAFLLAVRWRKRASETAFLASAGACAAAAYSLVLLVLVPPLNGIKSYRPFFEEIRPVLDGRRIFVGCRDERCLPLAEYYLGGRKDLLDHASESIERLRDPGPVGLVLSAAECEREEPRLAGTPHRVLCASRGKKDLVLVINH